MVVGIGRDDMVNEVRANKTGTAGDEQVSHLLPPRRRPPAQP
jgi:hypothetical protein